jgi:parallel beta-helix repeat protein
VKIAQHGRDGLGFYGTKDRTMVGHILKLFSKSISKKSSTTPRFEVLEDRTVPATFTVTNLNDNGAGSLRQAIIDANAAGTDDVIDFQAGLAGTILLTTGALTISDDVTINGPGVGVISVDGNTSSGVFVVQSVADEINVQISQLTITNGVAFQGGGIAVVGENLTLDNVVLTQNNAARGGGLSISEASADVIIRNSTIQGNAVETDGTAFGGGIDADGIGSLLIQDSTILANQAAGLGGGISIRNPIGPVTIDRSTVQENEANFGGGLFVEMASEGVGSLDIRNSTIASNTAFASSGGGIYISNSDGPILIENTTISDNRVQDGFGGGIYLDFASSTVVVRNTTIVENQAVQGGGIFNADEVERIRKEVDANVVTDPSGFQIISSIVANNISEADPDLAGSFNVTNSLIEDSGTAIIGDGGGNLFGVDPQLGVLANNGGGTQTHALLEGSPAIDAGSNPGGLTTDQRGGTFVRTSNGTTDIGAFEFQVAITPTSPDTGVDGTNEEEFECAFEPGTNEQFVCRLYHELLEREPDEGGFNSWLELLAGGHSRAEIVDGFIWSPEYLALKVSDLYQSLLDRDPTQEELNAWVGRILDGSNLTDAAKEMLASDEYLALNPLAESFIQGLYNDVLGRQPTPEEWTSWSTRIAEGEAPGQIACELLESEESVRRIISQFYEHHLDRTAEEPSLSQYVNQVQSGDKYLNDVLTEILASIEYYTM